MTHPGSFVIGAFGSLILIGTILLSLPLSQASGVPDVSTGDAFFSAASAVTVTGLVVVDTGTTWSWFGETVLLALIQIGGLGIMTLAGFVGISLNRKLGIRRGALVGAEIGLDDLGVLTSLIRDLVRFVLATEVVVAALLTLRFAIEGDHGILQSAHLGVFHAVSAFNNAGFSIFEGGLERYVGDWFVNLVVCSAFIIGGIGFPVVFEVRRRWRRPDSWSLHTRVTLSMTAILLVAGTVMIAVVEWRNEQTLGPLGSDAKVLASFFQSATARTAGFNTLPISAMHQASWLALILLMVVGASSASTGGGIKTSTLAVVFRSTYAEFRRDTTVTLFDRQIPLSIQRQALALVVAALGTVGTATFLLSALDSSLPVGELLFEAASAFGTVGISTGITEDLGWLARLIIIALMFIGRVGPITFGTAVLLRSEPKRFQYAEGSLIVG